MYAKYIYLRDKPGNYDATNQVDNDGDEDYVNASLIGDIILDSVEEIQSLGLEEEKDDIIVDSVDVDENHDSSAIDIDFLWRRWK